MHRFASGVRATFLGTRLRRAIFDAGSITSAGRRHEKRNAAFENHDPCRAKVAGESRVA
jgi:hypothetical protein